MSLTKKEISHFSEQLPEGIKIVDINQSYQQLKDYSVYDFVSQFHPNYSHCTTVTYADDMQCIVDNEYWEEGSGAEAEYFEIADRLGVTRDKEDKEAAQMIKKYAEVELAEANAELMERAIEGFIAYMKGGNNV